jgi:multiple sugar transport system permease protein
MNFVGWFVLVALVYLAIGSGLLVWIEAARRRRFLVVVELVVGYVIAGLIFYMADKTLQSHWFMSDLIIPTRFAWLAGIVCIWHWALAALEKKRFTWKDIKLRNDLSRQIKLHLALATGAIIFSIPFYWLITTSLKPDKRTNLFPPDLIPMEQRSVRIGGENRDVYLLRTNGRQMRVAKMAELENGRWQVKPVGKATTLIVPSARLKPDLRPVLLWRNYSDALKFLPPEYRMGLTPLWNTIYVTLLTIVGTVLSSSLVAFSFARLRWPGRDLLFVVLLATMMIPGAVTMLPVFLIFRWLGWIDTLRPLWFPALFGSAVNIFLLRQFFMTIPNDLEDAAKIDGCSYFTIYWKIMLPLIKVRVHSP